MDKTYIGVDLGGASLKLGEVSRGGKLLRREALPSGYLAQGEAMSLIERALESFLMRPAGEPAAIGAGLLGRIDGERGMWLELDHDRREEPPFAEEISGRFGLPCFIDNDVRSAAKAQRLFGCAGGLENWVYVNVGTGIGAAVFSGGRLVRGGHFNAGEAGHTTSGIGFHAPCSCGRPDCVELSPIQPGVIGILGACANAITMEDKEDAYA